jgi:hypothetical protein
MRALSAECNGFDEAQAKRNDTSYSSESVEDTGTTTTKKGRHQNKNTTEIRQ